VLTQEIYELVTIDESLRENMLDIDSWAFGFTLEPETAEAQAKIVPWDRARGVRITDGPLVACHSSHEYRMRVPGGESVAASGLTWVGVHPAHRRRGILTKMIDDHFARSLARGEVVSTLYAAEPKIYQRFGYGLACPSYALKLGRGPELREVAGSDDLRVVLESADIAVHGPVVREVFARTRRPGHHATLPDTILEDVFLDPPAWRQGRERRRIAAVYDAQGAAAFATFSRKTDWGDTGPVGTLTVLQWAAVDAASTRRLFSVLADFDLISTAHVKNIAPGDPLLHLLSDVRAVGVGMADNLWVRILDLPGAVSGRGYDADADVVVLLTDAQVPANAGLWRIRIADGVGEATRADDGAEAQVIASIQDLSAAYLGGVTLAELADAGLVTGDAGAIARLSAAWAGTMRPVSALNF